MATEKADPIIEQASALLRRGASREAVAFLKSQKALSIRGLDYLADAYFQLREWPEALAVVRAQLRLPGPPHPYRRLLEAKILANMARHAEALPLVKALLTQYGEQAECLAVAKICCYFLRDFDGARAFGQRALRLKDQASGPTPADAKSFTPREGGGDVIAYSVWGTRDAYLFGAAINVELAKRHFPGWRVRIYTDAATDARMGAIYRGLGAEVVLADRDFPDVPTYFWRFLVADDAGVHRYLCRDADARLGADEAQLVAQWLASGKPFHAMRDHLLHDDLMLAGLWGGAGSDGLRMRELVERYFNGKPSGKYGLDQLFLGAQVWPRIRPHVFVHDRFYDTEGVASHRNEFDLGFGAGHQDDAKVVAEAAAMNIRP